MIIYQSMDRAFDEFTDVKVESLSCFLYFLLEVPRNGAGKMNFQKWIVVLHDIPFEEVDETTDEQFVDFRYIPMHGKERRKASQKAVGLRLAIYFVYDLCRGKSGVYQKHVANVFGKLVFQTVACQSFA